MTIGYSGQIGTSLLKQRVPTMETSRAFARMNYSTVSMSETMDFNYIVVVIIIINFSSINHPVVCVV